MAEEVERFGIRSRRRKTKAGEWRGGNILSRGHIHYILSSPIYAGQIPHKGRFFKGQHPAIIDPERWDSVQQNLQDRANRPRQPVLRKTDLSPLIGKLFDEGSERLSPSHILKRGRRYRYYISRSYVTGRKGSLRDRGWRLPADQLERFIAQAIRDYLARPGSGDLLPDASVETLTRLRHLAEADRADLLEMLGTAQIRKGSIWP